MSELNWATMSDVEGSRSSPASLLASAWWYQVFSNGALGKLAWIVLGPALPSTALEPSQSSGSKFESTRISTLLGSRLPQMLAAYWKTYRRCSPTVVPGLPPTGVAGVGSLNPSPGPSRFTMVIVEAPAAAAP